MGVPIALGFSEDRASGAQVIDGGLRFDSSKSQHLTRTPSNAGNRRTFTWSGWVKRNKLGTYQYLLSAYQSGSYRASLLFNNDETLTFALGNTSPAITTTAVFRDISSWYHIVVSIDTTQATQSNGMKLYVNGVLQVATNSGTYTQNDESWINTTNAHLFGYPGNYYLDTQLSNVYFIDGQALDPSYFGYTDPLTNTWRPKKFKPQATPNNGTTWSSTGSDPNSLVTGGTSIANIFSGSVSVGTQILQSASNYVTLTTGPIQCNSTVSFLSGNGASTATMRINGSDTYKFEAGSTTVKWWDFSFSGTITKIEIGYLAGSGSSNTFYGIKVDGVPLVDTNTTNIGKNGFYLPFDGNSPIGQDQSGNGNNWTPVNFGGSNTLEKATGALPILNTDGGGKVARVGVRTDSNASSLVLALPLVGIKSDFSNAINSGTSNKAITNNGATVSTTQGNFYGGSFAFGDSNSQYLTASSSDFSFGTGAFTIECWYKFNVDGSGFEDVFVSQTDSNTGISLYMAGNDLYVRWGANPNWNRFSFTPATDRWYHIALVREGTGTGQTKVYIDGVSQTPVEGAFSIPTNFSETSINIGRFTNIASYENNGYMQDFRIYKGVAKYTSNFIPASTDPDILPDTLSGVSYSSNVALVPSTDGAVAFDGSGDYLSLASNADFAFGTGDFTFEFYSFFSGSLPSNATFYSNNYTGTQGVLIQSSSAALYFYVAASSVFTGDVLVAGKWQHILISRSSGTVRIFVDGALQASGTLSGSAGNSSVGVTLAAGSNGGVGFPLTGFISNFHVVNGTALYTANFTPPTAPITSVANTKLLCCKSNSSATVYDVSPGTITANGNAVASNFNPFTVNINTQRGQESGYCTWNPLEPTVGTLSNGNLTMVGSSAWKSTKGTVSVSSGKWYYEGMVRGNTYGTATGNLAGGIGWYTTKNLSSNVDASTSSLYTNLLGFHNTGQYNNFSTIQSSTGSMTAGDIIGVALNKDNNTFVFYKNGVSVVSGSLANTTDDLTPWTNAYYSSDSTWECNFGQKPFKFPPPAGFQPLALANTPRPTIVRPDQYVGISTWTGTGATLSLTTGFKPDLVWVKTRGAVSNDHFLFDSVRGATKWLVSNSTTFEQTGANTIISFDDKGFTTGSNNDTNASGRTFVAWCWKAGGNSNTYNINDVGYATASAAGLTAGDSNLLTGASINTKSGFSILKANAPSSNVNFSLPHGLGTIPKFIIYKHTGVSSNWQVNHASGGNNGTDNYNLNGTGAPANASLWDAGAHTTSVINFPNDIISSLGGAVIVYAWAEIPGFSKFGKYVGDGSTSGFGPYINCGFRPRYVLIKGSDAAYSWLILDSVRNPNNLTTQVIYADSSTTEMTNNGTGSGGYESIDILSNGFQIKSNSSRYNANGSTYIYAAFAESPSFNLYGGQANAR